MVLYYPSVHKTMKGTNNKYRAGECSEAICDRGTVKLLQAYTWRLCRWKKQVCTKKKVKIKYPGCKVTLIRVIPSYSMARIR